MRRPWRFCTPRPIGSRLTGCCSATRRRFGGAVCLVFAAKLSEGRGYGERQDVENAVGHTIRLFPFGLGERAER